MGLYGVMRPHLWVQAALMGSELWVWALSGAAHKSSVPMGRPTTYGAPYNSWETPQLMGHPTTYGVQLMGHPTSHGTPHNLWGAVLLADILPSLLVKMAAPFGAHLLPYSIRVVAVAVAAWGGCSVVASGAGVGVSLGGE
uniref:Uncharacterized protein n=1 Tax=Phasianus colchicus TaxID=9054 RepID=A0A669QJV1_PHACC